jgi:hypothetical protein
VVVAVDGGELAERGEAARMSVMGVDLSTLAESATRQKCWDRMPATFEAPGMAPQWGVAASPETKHQADRLTGEPA